MSADEISPPEQGFEEALADLEKVVRELEDGKTNLEDSLRHYEHGVSLLRRCHAQLRHAEQRILELIGVDEQGTPKLRPFEHTAKIDLVREKS